MSTLCGMAHPDPTQSIETMPEITETGLDGDPKVWFVVYVEATQSWCKIEAANVADIV